MDKSLNVRGIVRLTRLARNDSRNIFRDPLIALVFSAPALLLVFVYVLVPFAGKLLLEKLSVDISPYYPVIVLFMGSVSALMSGMVAGLMLLDDRDEKILMQVSVTPFGLLRYFVYRTVFLSLTSFVFSLVYMLLNPVVHYTLFQSFAASLFVALESIILALFLVLFAKNKVQGMSLGKLTGLTLMGPFTAFFIPAPFNHISMFIPTYWIAMVCFSQETKVFIFAAGGLVVHAALLWLLVSKTKKDFL